jgi:crotonobetainyl-CoA:carnitine CoA-transferase CaiB-like acyl-CoA transferase
VFVEAFRPGVAKKLGFDHATLRARNPRLVYASICAFGQDGPYRDVPAHDLAVEALAGVLSVNLGPDDRPAQPGVPASDMAASLMAFGGILMALYRREKTGRRRLPRHLDARQPRRVAAERARDGVRRGPAPGAEARTHLGRLGLLPDLPYEGRPLRRARRPGDQVRPEPARRTRAPRPRAARGARPRPAPAAAGRVPRATFATKTQAEWVEWFDGKDVSFAPVKDLKEALDDPHVAARGMVLTDSNGPPPPRRADQVRRRAGAPASPAGSASTRTGSLAIGYDAERIAALRAGGALG